jgi:hypothetical protein
MHCEPICRYSAQSSISAFFVTCPAHSYIYFAIYNLLVCSLDVCISAAVQYAPVHSIRTHQKCNSLYREFVSHPCRAFNNRYTA